MHFMPNKVYSLSSILSRIRGLLEQYTKSRQFWLKVEIASVNFHKNSGHYYLELIEIKDGVCIAKCKASIWKNSVQYIKQKLGKDFDNIVCKGNEILSFVEIQFTEQYGLNIIIKDIDLNFNLGVLEKRKQETLDKLKKEELLDLNKRFSLPAVIQKIAIIGSPETAGISDLLKQLNNNPYHYQFSTKIYSCLVQGDKAEEEIVNRLKELRNSKFDVIALIRGGGSKFDLDIFNSYNIAREIALHDKPIFTGIGHETDFSVADVVANLSHKTPTALGAYIVTRAFQFEVRIESLYNYIIEYKKSLLNTQKSTLQLNTQALVDTSYHLTRLRRGDLHTVLNRINFEAKKIIHGEKSKMDIDHEIIVSYPQNLLASQKRNLLHSIELLHINSKKEIEKAIDIHKANFDLIISYAQKICSEKRRYIENITEVVGVYHPQNILKKGYAIPRFKGKLLEDQKLKTNDEIEIELKNKIIIVSYIKNKEKWITSLMNKLLKN